MSLPELVALKQKELQSLKAVMLMGETMCQQLEEMKEALRDIGDGTEGMSADLSFSPYLRT